MKTRILNSDQIHRLRGQETLDIWDGVRYKTDFCALFVEISDGRLVYKVSAVCIYGLVSWNGSPTFDRSFWPKIPTPAQMDPPPRLWTLAVIFPSMAKNNLYKSRKSVLHKTYLESSRDKTKNCFQLFKVHNSYSNKSSGFYCRKLFDIWNFPIESASQVLNESTKTSLAAAAVTSIHENLN